MVEKVEIGNATLYLGDCREIVPTLGPDFVVASDPPYGVGYQWHGGGSRHGSGRAGKNTRNAHGGDRSQAIIGDDEDFDPAPLLRWPCLLFGADHFHTRLPAAGRWLSWDKRRNVCPPRSQSDMELIWCSEPGPRRICYHLWDGMVRDSELNIAKEHPTQKPVAVMQWCLGFLPDGQPVLDPYMGSGTTGVASVRLGRKFVGIEKDPGFFAVACRRVEEAQRQGDLFVAAGP